MARIERKAYYVGTWREDVVSDTTMRHIIARSLAEKGQKVKVKLSKDGLIISKTVLLQENFLASLALHDVYFLTVNQRHPTCLLCIVADPVRKYLILAIRTMNEVEAQELISTFKALKDNPTINAGNVVLRRKDNGNWTLRERSQHNATRHLLEVFSDSPTPTSTPSQPNGNAGGGGYSPVIDGSKRTNHSRHSSYNRDVGDGEIVSMKKEVDDLSEELRDVKFVVEKAGSVSSATLQRNSSIHKNDYHMNNNNSYHNNNTERSHYVETEPYIVTEPVPNGEVVRAHSNGDGVHEDTSGEVRVVVEDHRNDGVVRARSNGSVAPVEATTVVMRNGGLRHPITVPEPKSSSTSTTTNPANEDFQEIPAYKIHRRVSTEYVPVPDYSRKLSQAEPGRPGSASTRVSFGPEVVRRNPDRQFRSLRTSRSGVPTTILRPIEEIYAYPHMHTRPSILKRPSSGSVIMAPANTVFMSQPQQPANIVYVAHPVATMPHVRRRSRPSSIHVMEGNELKVFQKTGDVDDILL